MNPERRIVLHLEVDRDADPITGTLTHSGHLERPFTGWLGLSNAIESIRTGTDEPAERSVKTTGTEGGDA